MRMFSVGDRVGVRYYEGDSQVTVFGTVIQVDGALITVDSNGIKTLFNLRSLGVVSVELQ